MRAFGFDLTLSARPQLISIEDYRRAARRALPRMVWSFVDGGADDMVSLARNRSAFDRWELRSRVLTGHDRRDLSTTVAGVPLNLPVLLAPTGFTGLTHWQGDVAAARAAAARGTRYTLGTLASWSIEEVAAASGGGHFFQLYPSRADVARDLMRWARDAGMSALMVTVDVPVKGNREGELRTGMGVPPTLRPREALDMARHLPGRGRAAPPTGVRAQPRRSGRRLGRRGIHRAAGTAAVPGHPELGRRGLDAGVMAGQPVPQGVLDPEDAERAIALGADGIVVSNHGGRQLDHATAPLDALPAVVAAVGGAGQVLVDGGIRRGTDVVKALCLGADAVMLGRPYLYGLAVGGESGVINVLDILRAELDRALTLMGVAHVRDLDRSWLIERDGRPSGVPNG